MNLEEVLKELESWWFSETDRFRALVASLVASLPGGEELADFLGMEEGWIGWKEAELLGKLLLAMKDASDVERVAKAILSDFEGK